MLPSLSPVHSVRLWARVVTASAQRMWLWMSSRHTSVSVSVVSAASLRASIFDKVTLLSVPDVAMLHF